MPSGPARRIYLRWKNGQLSKIREDRLPQKRLAPSHPAPNVPKLGFSLQVEDVNGNVLYRRRMRDPRSPWVELMNGDGSFSNVLVQNREVDFEVLVPDAAGAKRLLFTQREPDLQDPAVTQTVTFHVDI